MQGTEYLLKSVTCDYYRGEEKKGREKRENSKMNGWEASIYVLSMSIYLLPSRSILSICITSFLKTLMNTSITLHTCQFSQLFLYGLATIMVQKGLETLFSTMVYISIKILRQYQLFCKKWINYKNKLYLVNQRPNRNRDKPQFITMKFYTQRRIFHHKVKYFLPIT